ncbi:hypothetical protein A2U01_0017371, partial [Trifolium medium]|nr:hypothetical protein [Trifolium medium]
CGTHLLERQRRTKVLVEAVGDGRSTVELAELFRGGWWWWLLVGVAMCLVAVIDGKAPAKTIPQQLVVLPAANVATGSDSEAQRQVTISEPALIPGLATAVLTVLLSQPSHP